MAEPEFSEFAGQWQVHLDLHITRRKTYHTVLDPSGAVSYSARYFSEVLAWLDMMGVKAYVLFPNPSNTLGLPLKPTQIERS